MNDAYRVRADITDENDHATSVSFIVRSGRTAGWKRAVEQAHQQLEGCTINGPVLVDQIWPSETEE
jgi:hypothetical protein